MMLPPGRIVLQNFMKAYITIEEENPILFNIMTKNKLTKRLWLLHRLIRMLITAYVITAVVCLKIPNCTFCLSRTVLTILIVSFCISCVLMILSGCYFLFNNHSYQIQREEKSAIIQLLFFRPLVSIFCSYFIFVTLVPYFR